MSDDDVSRAVCHIFMFAGVTGWLLLKFVIDPIIGRNERKANARRLVEQENFKYQEAAEREYESWEK